MNCLHCGSPAVDDTGYCRECGVNQRIIAKAYNTSNYYYNLGLDRARIRDLTGAKEVLQLALKYNKKNISARNLLGLVYYETGEWVLALSHWVISTNYDPDRKNPAMGYVKKMQSNASRLETNGRLASKYNQALAHAQSGSLDLAMMQLKKLLTSNPKFVKGYLLMSLLYIHDEEYDKARKSLKRVLKVDRFNPFAIRYLRELDIPEEYEDEDMDDEYVKELAMEVQKPDLGDIIEGRELDDRMAPSSLQIGSYRDVNIAKFTLVYVFVGLILGIVTMAFLILPSRENAVRDEYKDIKLTFSDEIAKKNASISDLQSEVSAKDSEIEQLNKKLEDQKQEASGSGVYESLFEAKALSDAGKHEEAIWKLENISADSYQAEAAKKMYTDIMDAGKGKIYESIYQDGMTAYDDQDFEKAIKYLKMATSIDAEKVDAWYFLGKAYEASSKVEEAQKIKDYINENFPDSQYASGSSSRRNTSSDNTDNADNDRNNGNADGAAQDEDNADGAAQGEDNADGAAQDEDNADDAAQDQGDAAN